MVVEVIDLRCIFSIAKSISHALHLHYFQWYGSRFPCSGEKKPKAGTAILPVVQGILFWQTVSLVPWKLFL
jgi:hypothetical protein